ncbi:uncharacterized protein LOC114312709 isoform X3 [Camellia sinensis]|uniref:uncharacterized protein LOC114312709 isoform X3 n=1 Tax=Camellia sinensis TaxID=4442 RepID=UPI0010360047|nr:uncharacterized protein LOC114312709 isoform X3 [Camellia sinensis]
MTLGTYGLDSNYVNQMGGRNVEKAKFASSPSSVLFYCTGFARPSRAITSATFGSDLNIETLVAAAERKETPLEVTRQKGPLHDRITVSKWSVKF